MVKKRLTLAAPGLFRQFKDRELTSGMESDQPSVEMPNLARLLSKSTQHHLSASENHLAQLANLSNLSNFNHQARAALYLHNHSHSYSHSHSQSQSQSYSEDQWCCYVSPVLMQPNRDHLSIVKSTDFDFTDDELKTLCAEFNDYFKEDGFQFLFLTPQRWICYSTHVLSVTNTSPHDILGENIITFLPSRDSDVLWRKLFNETQMLLHHSATNQARILAGKVEINSLWFWAGGKLPAPFKIHFDGVMTNDDEVAGYAKLGGVECEGLPQNLTQAQNQIDTLVYVDLVYVDTDQAMNERLEQYAETILTSLKQKTWDEVLIIPDEKQSFTVKRGDLNKFWKSVKPLSAFI